MILVTGGCVPMETIEDLLDLLCYYNSAEPPETPYMEELHYQLYRSGLRTKPNRNTWK